MEYDVVAENDSEPNPFNSKIKQPQVLLGLKQDHPGFAAFWKRAKEINTRNYKGAGEGRLVIWVKVVNENFVIPAGSTVRLKEEFGGFWRVVRVTKPDQRPLTTILPGACTPPLLPNSPESLPVGPVPHSPAPSTVQSSNTKPAVSAAPVSPAPSPCSSTDGRSLQSSTSVSDKIIELVAAVEEHTNSKLSLEIALIKLEQAKTNRLLEGILHQLRSMHVSAQNEDPDDEETEEDKIVFNPKSL